MRRLIIIAFLLAVPGLAHAELTPAERAMLDRINNDPASKTEALARLSTGTSEKKRMIVVPPEKTASKAQSSPDVPKQKPTAYNPQQSPCAGFSFLLRQDWKDIDLTACPGKAKDAHGAQFSFTNDIASGNKIWAVDGTAAIVFNSLLTPPNWWQPTYVSFGGYGSLDRSFNSATAFTASDSDKVAYGGFLQLGFVSDQLQNFFRLRGGIAENRLKDTTASNFIAEYIPVYDPLFIHYPTGPILGLFRLRFDPSAFAQYSEVTGKKQVLPVNNETEALRVGVQATLRLLPDLGAEESAPLRAAVTYRWSTETYTGRELSWFQSEITYNLDKAGHVALGFTYKRGDDEETGDFTKVYKIGLTGKL